MALAVLAVVLYEVRTLLEFLGVAVPIGPYMLGVFLVIVVVALAIGLTGGWREESSGDGAT